MTVAKRTRPILRYHGGKWMLAPWIISHFPEHRIYVEPFGGAASCLLQKRRSYGEVYNDLSGEVCNLFRVVRDQGETLRQKLYLTPFARDDYRESFEEAQDPVEQARRTVIRSMMGFGSNSLCRDIKSGFRSCSNRSGTTPAHDWTHYPDVLVEIIERLRGVCIENKDAKEVMAQHDKEDALHYCDPPYVHATRTYMRANGNHGYEYEMTDQEHAELASFLRGLKGMVIVSGYDCPLYADLYNGWRTEKLSALADGAREREECLWFSPSVKIKQMELFCKA